MGASGTDNFCLRWNDFAENVSGAFKDLRAESDFFDVTLACSDSGARTLPAHKVILSACSNFFKTTFRQQMNANKHPNPYIYLRGVTYNDLASILDFIYNGEVNVAQEDLNSFLAVAEELQIKGLTNRDNTSGAENNSNSKRPKIRQANPDTPPVKKVRRSSPVPSSSSSSGAAASQIVTPVIDDKEVVNIKDDPEAVLASTSAVNPDDSADFGGEEYDESYDNYYEDEGAELGEGAEGSDGTKGRHAIFSFKCEADKLLKILKISFILTGKLNQFWPREFPGKMFYFFREIFCQIATFVLTNEIWRKKPQKSRAVQTSNILTNMNTISEISLELVMKALC